MKSIDGVADGAGGADASRRNLRWRTFVGSALAVAVLVWLASKYGTDAMWREMRAANLPALALGLPLLVANMVLRALRWRNLLGPRGAFRLTTVFGALMIGYLSNTLLPARAGDLVRVYVLSRAGAVTWSRALSTIVIERVLDMAAVIGVLAIVAAASPVPQWLRYGALLMAGGTVVGVVALVLLGLFGEHLIGRAVAYVAERAPTRAERLGRVCREFTAGIQRIGTPGVALIFTLYTAAIWALELAIVLVVAQAFDLELALLDAAVLMLFSLFSSLIPALPGQLGTFEIAMVSGLAYLGHGGTDALPFALALHVLLLGGTAVLGYLCLLANAMPLTPRSLADQLARARQR